MRICIFCGSSSSTDPEVQVQVKKVMTFFYEHNIELVYGGAAIGIMGALANELLSLGGKVTGVIPRRLMNKEVAHAALTELHVVTDMHERKKMMYDLSDAFLIFPGGMGTLDELFETLTWGQLEIHKKPVGILNINGYYSHLLKFIDHSIEHGLVRSEHKNLFRASSNWDELWPYMSENP